MWPRWVSAALGVWLVVAPTILPSGVPAATHDRVVGPVIVAVAIVAMAEVTRPLRWINLAIGAWLVVAPFVLGYQATPMANSILVGVALCVFASVRGRRTKRYGGGWSALVRRRTPSSLPA